MPLKGATLPPLVQIREILHRRITDIKAALQRFRAKKGLHSPSKQSSSGSVTSTHKQPALSKEQNTSALNAPPSSAPAAEPTVRTIGDAGLALHDARLRGEAVVPPGLAVAAAVRQREDEQGGGGRRTRTVTQQEGQEVLAPAGDAAVKKGRQGLQGGRGS